MTLTIEGAAERGHLRPLFTEGDIVVQVYRLAFQSIDIAIVQNIGHLPKLSFGLDMVAEDIRIIPRHFREGHGDKACGGHITERGGYRHRGLRRKIGGCTERHTDRADRIGQILIAIKGHKVQNALITVADAPGQGRRRITVGIADQDNSAVGIDRNRRQRQFKGGHCHRASGLCSFVKCMNFRCARCNGGHDAIFYRCNRRIVTSPGNAAVNTGGCRQPDRLTGAKGGGVTADLYCRGGGGSGDQRCHGKHIGNDLFGLIACKFQRARLLQKQLDLVGGIGGFVGKQHGCGCRYMRRSHRGSAHAFVCIDLTPTRVIGAPDIGAGCSHVDRSAVVAVVCQIDPTGVVVVDPILEHFGCSHGDGVFKTRRAVVFCIRAVVAGRYHCGYPMLFRIIIGFFCKVVKAKKADACVNDISTLIHCVINAKGEVQRGTGVVLVQNLHREDLDVGQGTVYNDACDVRAMTLIV